METWKSHLEGVLRRLADSHGHTPVGDLRRTLASILNAEDVIIQHPDGRVVPDATLFRELEGQSLRVHVAVRAGVSRALEPPVNRESRFHPGEAPAGSTVPTADRYDEFIREFARLEHHHEFMWAGYVVRELMPRIGFPPSEAKLILDRLCSEGILRISKVPNPRNPSFPATGVEMNYEHPRVQEVLDLPTVERLSETAPGASSGAAEA